MVMVWARATDRHWTAVFSMSPTVPGSQCGNFDYPWRASVLVKKFRTYDQTKSVILFILTFKLQLMACGFVDSHVYVSLLRDWGDGSMSKAPAMQT